MSNFKAIADNIRTADILLVRMKDTLWAAQGYWEHAYIWNGECLIGTHGQWELRGIAWDWADVGLFRVVYNLDEEEKKELHKAIKYCIFFHHWWPARLWRWLSGRSKVFTNSELIARAFNKIDRRFNDKPVSEMTPSDFDKSGITVRIA